MRKRSFSPRIDELESKISLSTVLDLPPGPVTPGSVLPTEKPIAPPGMGNPGNVNTQPLPPGAPPLPAGDYNPDNPYGGVLV